MKKLIGLILISLFLFSSSVFAEKWESAGTWGVASVEIDTDSILPVTPVHSSIPVRFTYQYTMKISSKNYSVTTTQVIDLRRNYRLIQEVKQSGTVPDSVKEVLMIDQKGKWVDNTRGLTFPYIYGYIYQNQDKIEDREAYQLSEKEKGTFTHISFTSPGIDWKTSFEKGRLSGWIHMGSVQITEAQEGKVPALRFVGSTSYAEDVEPVEYLFFTEIDPNSPATQKLYYQWESTGKRKSNWELFVNKPNSQSKPFDNKTDMAYLASTAYIYLITYADANRKTIYFNPSEAPAPAEKWLKMAK